MELTKCKIIFVAIKLFDSNTQLFTIAFYRDGSLGFAPTFKIGFVVTGREIYLYYIHQGNKSDKERKNGKKKFYAYKKI